MTILIYYGWVIGTGVSFFARKGNVTLYSASYGDLLFLVEKKEGKVFI